MNDAEKSFEHTPNEVGAMEPLEQIDNDADITVAADAREDAAPVDDSYDMIPELIEPEDAPADDGSESTGAADEPESVVRFDLIYDEPSFGMADASLDDSAADSNAGGDGADEGTTRLDLVDDEPTDDDSSDAAESAPEETETTGDIDVSSDDLFATMPVAEEEAAPFDIVYDPEAEPEAQDLASDLADVSPTDDASQDDGLETWVVMPEVEPLWDDEPQTYGEPQAYDEAQDADGSQAYGEPQVYDELQAYDEPQAEPLVENAPAPAPADAIEQPPVPGKAARKGKSRRKGKKPSERRMPRRPVKLLALGAAAALIAISAGMAYHFSSLAKAYDRANDYFANGEYTAAAEAYAALGDYEDAARLYEQSQLWIDAKAKEDAAGKDPEAWDAAAEAYEAIEDLEASKAAKNCRNMATYYRGAQKLAEKPGSLETVEAALEFFQNCGGVLDSDKKIEHCENLKSYYRGVWRIEHHPNSTKYLKQALKLLKSCGGVMDAEKQIEICENGLSYLSAKKLMEEQQWAKAAAAFEELAAADFRDSAKLKAECETRADYEEAESMYEEGRYYEAYSKFLSIGDTDYEGLPDMQERANACIQDMPASGVMYHSDYYSDACQLTINNTGNPNAYYKLYIGDELVIAAFVREDSEQSFELPAGTYSMNKGYGESWFGTTDLFGDEGSYYKCTFGGSETFTLDADYAYIISSGTDGTGIDTKSMSRDSM